MARLIPLLAVLAALAAAPADAAAPAVPRGVLRTAEGVRLSGISAAARVRLDGRVQLQVLVTGRARRGSRKLVLGVAACTRAAPACRTVARRRVRFRTAPRALIGWHPALADAASLRAVRLRLAAPGAPSSRATAELVLTPAAWRAAGPDSGLFVREDPRIAVEAASFRARPGDGGAARVEGAVRITSPTAFPGRTSLGPCGAGGPCPWPVAPGATAVGRGTTKIPIGAVLAPAAGATRVRWRLDGGVRPSPFVSLVLPWPGT